MPRVLAVSISCLFVLSLFVSVHGNLNKWEATSFCKCICFQSNYSILHLDNPDTPSQPCLSCTKQWCLNQNLPICAGAMLGDINPDTATGKEGDVEARCFQRDSPRDQLVVTLFLLTVFGLLLGAGVKSRIAKAGLASELPWNSNRRWWESWLPRRQFEFEDVGLSMFGSRTRHDTETRMGDYVPVPSPESSRHPAYQTSPDHRMRTSLSNTVLSGKNFVSFKTVTTSKSQYDRIVGKLNSSSYKPQDSMGSLCSKSSIHSGGHTVLGSNSEGRNTIPQSHPDPRAAAAEAAERRMKAAQARGTNSSNPKQGRLAAQVAKQNSKAQPEPPQEERLVWD